MSLILMTRILPLREGSIIVPYTLTFDGFSSVTLNDIVTAFNATVQEPTRELSQTDLFLALTSDGGIGDTVGKSEHVHLDIAAFLWLGDEEREREKAQQTKGLSVDHYTSR